MIRHHFALSSANPSDWSKVIEPDNKSQMPRVSASVKLYALTVIRQPDTRQWQINYFFPAKRPILRLFLKFTEFQN